MEENPTRAAGAPGGRAKAAPRWGLAVERGFQAFLVLFSACFVGGLVLRPFGDAGRAFSDLMQTTAGLAGGLTIVLLALGMRGTDRRSWLLIGAAAFVWGGGQAVWTIRELVLGQETPFPSLADVGFLAMIPLMFGGLITMSAPGTRPEGRLKVGLDAAIVMASIGAVSWFAVLGPMYTRANQPWLEKAIGLAYPAGDLLYLFALVRGVVSGWIARRTPSMGPLVLGIVLFIVADLGFALLTIHDAYISGGVLDLGWPLGILCLTYAAVVRWARGATPPQRAAEAPPAWLRWLRRYGLYALLLVVAALAYGSQLTQGGAGPNILLAFARAAILLIVVRQFLTQRENERLNQELQALATTDPLTELPNHRAMVASLDRELDRSRRFHRPCAVLFVDLDHFKALNDSCGHVVGDAALRELAHIVRATLRGIDVLGRWGGEEFLAILPESDDDLAKAIAERVRAAVAGHDFAAGGGMHVTCSIGVATFPVDARQRDDLVDAADRAMYAAKRLGRNRVSVASDIEVAVASVSSQGSRQEAALLGTVDAVMALMAARDLRTAAHGESTATVARRLALALGYDPSLAHIVGLAARLHDVGKIALPDAVLHKPAALAPDEWRLVQTHARTGADIIAQVPALRALAPIVAAHHERWDGQGYPAGLRGEEIPVGARILAVADTYGALLADRAYRPKVDAAASLALVRQGAGTQFDPAVVVALERVVAGPAE